MDKRVLKYDKSTNERELYPVHSSSTESSLDYNSETPLINKKELPLSYIKTDGVLSYNIICVISGGSVRERVFLTEIEKKKTFKKLNLIFLTSNEGGLTPKMMLNEYNKICANGCINIGKRKIKLDDVDKVYMITDVDHYEEELKNILNTQNANGLPIWIISNPCFEIWIYYCYRNNPQVDLQNVIQEQRSLRSSRLKTVNGRFNNGGGLDPRKAFEHLKDGISNSRRFYNEIDGIPNLLSTQMHIFAEDVLEMLGNEYAMWLKKVEESRLQFRK